MSFLVLAICYLPKFYSGVASFITTDEQLQ